MNPEIQEQRAIEIIRETCRKLDVKFSYEVAGDCEDGIYLLPVYDRGWRKRRAQWWAGMAFCASLGGLGYHAFCWLTGDYNRIQLLAHLGVFLSARYACFLADRMPTIPSVILHWFIDGELIASGFQVRRHSDNGAEISYRG